MFVPLAWSKHVGRWTADDIELDSVVLPYPAIRTFLPALFPNRCSFHFRFLFTGTTLFIHQRV